MARDDEYLLDILQAARLAMSYVAGGSESAFFADTQCQDAVIRRLEVIGEAAGRVSQEKRDSLPELPWSAMIGMRNIMIHRYDDVDMKIVWDSVQGALPPLVAALAKVVPPQGTGD